VGRHRCKRPDDQGRPLVGGLNDFGAGTVISPPGRNGIADGMAYVPGKDRILYAIDLTTDKLKWHFDYGAGTGTNYDGGRSAPALVGRTLVFGTTIGVVAVDAVGGADGVVSSFSESAGTPVWSKSVGNTSITGAMAYQGATCTSEQPTAASPPCRQSTDP